MKKVISQHQKTWKLFIRRVCNTFILAGITLACCMSGKHVLTRINHADSYLRWDHNYIVCLLTLIPYSLHSPYTTIADMLNINAESGLRLKIPKPVLLQVRLIQSRQAGGRSSTLPY